MAETGFEANHFLAFEKGPSETVHLQWATYYDAADEAGLSRLWGGIHIPADDFAGRRLGSQIGLDAFQKTQRLRRAGTESPGSLINLSARAPVGGDENDVMITGFVVDSGASQTVVLRSVGPGLSAFGISGYAADARIDVYRSDRTLLLSNDNWDVGIGAGEIATLMRNAGAFPLASGQRDAAVCPQLPAGGYTVVTQAVSPAAGGEVLAEIYGRRLINLSTRVRLEPGGSVTVGFVLDGVDSQTVLVRAVGPGLTQLGVIDVLHDPMLQVYRHESDGAHVIAENDNWSDDDRASLTVGAAVSSGAFSLPDRSRDAALVLQLTPGAHSAVVTSADGAEGVVLVEVYLLR